MKKLVTGLIVAALLLTAPGSAQPAPVFTNECHDLNDNLVPPGWMLDVWWGNAGIANGKLSAQPVDACGRLKRVGTMSPGVTSIKLEYDGNIAYAYWGLVNGAGVATSTDTFMVMDAMAEYNFGLVNRALVVHYPSSPWSPCYEGDHPLEFTQYHYTAIFKEGAVSYKAARIADGAVLFDLAIDCPGLRLNQVREVFFHAYATTDNACWLDNLCVEMLGPTLVDVDIKPRSCPNPLKVRSRDDLEAGSTPFHGNRDGDDGVLPVAVLGTASFNVADIDPATVRLDTVAPLRHSYEDVATPVSLRSHDDDRDSVCPCTDEGPDGHTDLLLKFSKAAVAAAIGPVKNGTEVPLTLTAHLRDGAPVTGSDCVLIHSRGKDDDLRSADRDPWAAGAEPRTLLTANSPNPFNGTTVIEYTLDMDGPVKIEVFDILGRKVATLTNEVQSQGPHQIDWNGTNARGETVASGLYFYRLTTGGFAATKKMILLK